MHTFWFIRLKPGHKDDKIWIYRSSLPAVKCSECGEVWGLLRRLPQLIPNQLNGTLRRVESPASWEHFQEVRQWLVDSDELTIDPKLLEPGVMIGLAQIKKFPSGISFHSHVVNQTLLLSEEAADGLRPFDRKGLYLLRCCPPYDKLIEVVPISFQRHQLFPNARCSKCGMRDSSQVNELYIRNLLTTPTILDQMVTLPGGTLVGKLLKQKLETMRIPQVTFEGVTIEDLVSYAKSVQG